ncbi:MAG: hypothetical protein HQL14_08870 [Candidatus Omnitrophica bacterium]|nr:hypothetical protein [Candidatus Omnitrophota bacterium]
MCFTTQILILSLLMYLGLYAGVGLLTNAYQELFSTENLSREILHFFPLVPILIVLTNYKAIKPEKSGGEWI